MENLIDIKEDKKKTIKSHLLINFSSDLILEEDFSSKSKIDNKNQFIKMFSCLKLLLIYFEFFQLHTASNTTHSIQDYTQQQPKTELAFCISIRECPQIMKRR